MAAMMTSAAPKPPMSSSASPSGPIAPLGSRSPLSLSSAQESQVLELYHKRVRTKCADEVRDFAACCTNRTFTATIMCRAQQKAMNTCMNQHATQTEKDAAREEWFATLDRRREEREAKERKRLVDEQFWKDWWDKDLKRKPGQVAEAKGRVAGGEGAKGRDA